MTQLSQTTCLQSIRKWWTSCATSCRPIGNWRRNHSTLVGFSKVCLNIGTVSGRLAGARRDRLNPVLFVAAYLFWIYRRRTRKQIVNQSQATSDSHLPLRCRSRDIALTTALLMDMLLHADRCDDFILLYFCKAFTNKPIKLLCGL